MKRRTFLNNALALSATSAVLSTGLVTPQWVMAADEPASPFSLKTLDEVLKALNAVEAKPSTEIEITVPEIAENGAVVPVGVATTLAGASTISIAVSNNSTPLAASFTLSEATIPNVSTRIKMAKTAEVVAVVKTADGSTYVAKKEVKVTIGGCGG
jgi:sulfur-oxidizing protein SoxY